MTSLVTVLLKMTLHTLYLRKIHYLKPIILNQCFKIDALNFIMYI